MTNVPSGSPDPFSNTYVSRRTQQFERYGQSITFQGWDGGEFGIMEAGIAARQSAQMFHAKNMVLYTNGYLGPRPGLKKITIASMPTGIIKGMEAAIPSSGTGPWFWVCIGSTTVGNFYLVDIGAGTVSSAYAAGTATTLPLAVNAPIPRGSSFGNGEWINVYVQGLYLMDHDAKTVTIQPSLTGGYVSGAWRQRFIATDNSQPGGLGSRRLFYSDPNDDPLTDTWPVLNFYDIGSVGAISFIRPFRDGIMIGKQDGSMWYLTGALGAAQLKQLTSGGAPINESRAVMLDSNIVYYMRYSSPYVSSFNGSVHQQFKHLQFTGGVFGNDSSVHTGWPAFRMETLPWLSPDSFMVMSGLSDGGSPDKAKNRAMIHDNDIFTYHTWEVDIDPWCASMGSILPSTRGIDTLSNSPYVVLAHGSDASYYKFAIGLDRPAFVSDTNASPGDGSNTPVDAFVQTPEWWDGEGRQIRVEQIVVDYEAWNIGTGNCGFGVQVDALHRFGSAARTAGSTVTAVNTAASSYSTTGDKLRWQGGVAADTGAGGGFQITVSGVKGCAIRSITAILSDKAVR